MKRTLVLVSVSVGVIAVILASLVLGKQVQAMAANNGVSPTPPGMKKYLVFMAHNVVQSPDPLSFQRDIMKRTPTQIAAEKAKAEKFFLDAFGLDFSHAQVVSGTDTIDNAMLFPTLMDDSDNYRAYVVSGEAVPAGGWVVHDGGWAAMLTKDSVLHGTYGGEKGMPTAAGEAVTYGEYKIDVPNKAPIVIQYESTMPMAGTDPMGMLADCVIHNAQWGTGRELGAVGMAMEGPGMTTNTVRMVLTFDNDMPMDGQHAGMPAMPPMEMENMSKPANTH